MDTVKVRLTIAFDGTHYEGWQIQKIGLGVQQKIEEALGKLFPSRPRAHSSSRTDSGVHALGMVAHFEVPRPEFRIPIPKLLLGLNAHLPEDIRVIVSDVPATVAGMFTTNQACAAPVKICVPRVQKGVAQAIVVNSGNANACTGAQGLRDAEAMTKLAARILGVPPETVFVGSTGRIGVTMPMDNVRHGIDRHRGLLRGFQPGAPGVRLAAARPVAGGIGALPGVLPRAPEALSLKAAYVLSRAAFPSRRPLRGSPGRD